MSDEAYNETQAQQDFASGRKVDDIYRDLIDKGGFTPADASKIIHGLETAKAQTALKKAKNPFESLAAPAIVEPLVSQIAPVLANVPAELKMKPNWVRWKSETVNGRLTKVPYQLNGHKAESNNPATWTTFEAVADGATLDETQGIGFMMDGSCAGFDLDGCRDPQTEKITEWAQQIIDTLDSYTEITPSGYGARVLVHGELPEGFKHVFNLDLAAGYGDKVKVEIYNKLRYFTVTGCAIRYDGMFGTSMQVESRDLTKAYALCQEIQQQYSPKKKEKDAASITVTSDDDSQPVSIEREGFFDTTKYNIFMNGTIESRSPFIISDGNGRVEYPSQSEADMAFATVLAIIHKGDREKISKEFRDSKLYRPKWDRLENTTIDKAIELAAKHQDKNVMTVNVPTAAQVQADAAVKASAGATGVFPKLKTIPDFDDSAITGIYRDIVNAATAGTTIPRQFAFLAAKVHIGAMIAGNIKFENMEDTSCYYGVPSRKRTRRCSGDSRRARRLLSLENPNSVLPPVQRPVVPLRRNTPAIRRPAGTSEDTTGNEDQRLYGVGYARPKRATGAGIVGCTWDT